MTRYVFPGNMLENCTDADLDNFYPSHISVGAGSTPVFVDWDAIGGANPFVSIAAWAGHVEIYKTGTRIYDDHGTPALNPSGGHVAASLKIQFKITDVRGGVSTEVAQDTLYLQGLVPGSDPVAPTVIDMVPAVGATGIAVDGLITLTWSKVLLPGAGSVVIRNATTNATIETLTLPAALDTNYPPAAGKVYLSDDKTVINPTADFPVGVTIAVRPGADFVRNLTGTQSAAITTDVLSFATVPGASGSLWGYTAGVDYGMVGDMFVDQASGNDSNNGLTFGTAKKTISAALAAWPNNTGGKIKVAAGVYKEMPTMKSGASAGNPLIIEPYGTAAPIVSGAEPMTTGWSLCTIADAPLVGANWAVMYKKTGVPVSTFTRSDPMNANLFAGSTRLNIARKYRYGQNVSAWCRSLDFLTADTITVAGGEISAYQHAALLAAFTPFQLQKSIMVCQEAPNVVSFRKCTISGANIIPASTVTQDTNTGVGWHKNFAMFNLIAAMEQGGWAYDWDGVSANCDLYCWLPAGKTTADITYSARMNGFVSGGSNHHHKGLIIERMSGSGNSPDKPGTAIFTDYGSAIAAGATGTSRANLRAENCIFRDGWQNNLGPGTLGHVGGISVSGCNSLTVRKCSFLDLQCSEGITCTQSSNILAEWNLFDKVLREDFWPRASSKVVYAHNLHTGSMHVHSHNNGVAFYVCNEALEWGNIWKNATFFGTWQDANNIQFCFNVFDWVGSYNALKDQSGSVNGFASTIGGMMLHNTLVYSAHRIWPVSQSILLQEGPAHPFSVKGNIYYGATYTGTTFSGNGGNINTRNSANLPAATGNQYEDIDVTFRDRANGDYSIGPASVVRTTPGPSIAAELAALAATYPFFTDFTDPFGQAINAAAPTIGAMVNPDINPMLAA